ncbi:hypothetical protein MBRA1_001375 [Malassezia brasiliensis]|uniref:Glycosyltransferase family 69 protein n=1 Tax=Malassezia brasiliensis TaxID=1821822 RepID=A0AAF0IPB1_9BASI|nr:hypothetical protein MBRA1_001375 [Malassezia brasiliensis]
MKAEPIAPREAYELDTGMDDGETEAFLQGRGSAFPPHAHDEKRTAKESVASFIRSPYGAIALVSLAVVVVLSIYFYVPSTLFVYLVCMLFAFPLVLVVDVARMLHHRRLPPSLGAWLRLGLCTLTTAYAAMCVVGAVLDTPYTAPRAPPVRVAHSNYNPTNQTYFIASNLFNSERILPRYTDALLQFIDDVGAHNVYVSIYENDSQDRTPELLRALSIELRRRGVRRRIKTVTKRKGFKHLERIRRLAYLRNEAMDPLWVELGGRLDGRPFDRVIFLNDILYDAAAVHTLLATNGGVFDQACAIDYYAIGLYDTWVTRDVDASRARTLWPFFARRDDQARVDRGEAVLANACWNGLVAFDARWFLPQGVAARAAPPRAPGAPVPAIEQLPRNATLPDGEAPAKLPLRFRQGVLCRASECLLTSLDMHRLAQPVHPLIYVNPRVAVAYDRRDYYMYHNLVHWRLAHPWHVVWEYWVATRLFGAVSDIGRKIDSCHAAFLPLWAPAP